MTADGRAVGEEPPEGVPLEPPLLTKIVTTWRTSRRSRRVSKTTSCWRLVVVLLIKGLVLDPDIDRLFYQSTNAVKKFNGFTSFSRTFDESVEAFKKFSGPTSFLSIPYSVYIMSYYTIFLFSFNLKCFLPMIWTK